MIGNLGAIFSTLGDDAKAVEYFLRSLKISESSGDSIRIATCLMNIGYIYSSNFISIDKALPYYLDALVISEKINYQDGVGFSSFDLGDIFFQKENFDSALYYFEKSLTVNENTVDVSASLNYIGRIYAEKGDLSKALTYQTNALEIAKEFDAKLEKSQALLGIANTYKKMGNLDLAIKYYMEAQEIALSIGSDHDVKDAYEGLALSFADLSDYRNAYKYQTLFGKIKDSIFSIETDDKIKGLTYGYKIEKKQDEIEILEQESEIEQLKTKRQKVISGAASALGFLLLILAIVLYRRYIFTQKTKKIIQKERDKSDELLLNILPSETAEELKVKGKAKARRYDNVSILFTDFKGFTSISAKLSPEDLVKEIHHCYKRFDKIMGKYGIEKIKTIGDAYMAAGGLPVSNTTHPLDVVKAAMEIRNFMLGLKAEREKDNLPFFEIRIGIHSGPVVAGIVGIKKFAYDIWGDTVNIASRMESNSEPGKINISETTHELIKDHYDCDFRGEIEAKNRGKLKMYFVKKEIQIGEELVI